MDNYQFISFSDMAAWRNKRIVSDALTGDICILDERTFEVEQIIKLPKDEMYPNKGILYFSKLQVYENQLYMFPSVTDRCVVSYNLINGEWEVIQSPTIDSRFHNILNPESKKGKYYIQILEKPERGIWVFDMENGEYVDPESVMIDINRSLKDIKGTLMPYLFNCNDISYIGVSGSNRLLWINWDKCKVGYIRLPHSMTSDITGISFDGKDYWIYCDGNESVLRISHDEKRDSEEIALMDVKNIYPFIDCGERILLCDWKQGDLSVFDKKNGKTTSLKDIMPANFATFGDIRTKTIGAYGGYEIIPDGVRLFPGGANMMLDVDMEKYRITGKSIRIDDMHRGYDVANASMDYSKLPVALEKEIREFGLFKNGFDCMMKSLSKNPRIEK